MEECGRYECKYKKKTFYVYRKALDEKRTSQSKERQFESSELKIVLFSGRLTSVYTKYALVICFFQEFDFFLPLLFRSSKRFWMQERRLACNLPRKCHPRTKRLTPALNWLTCSATSIGASWKRMKRGGRKRRRNGRECCVLRWAPVVRLQRKSFVSLNTCYSDFSDFLTHFTISEELFYKPGELKQQKKNGE